MSTPPNSSQSDTAQPPYFKNKVKIRFITILCCSPESIYWDSFGLKANVNRDRKVQEELKTMGWKILIIWECELPDLDKVKRSLKESL